ncbi:MAG: hypothetical protein AAFZ65_01745 [Planctomycetota bacterium]
MDAARLDSGEEHHGPPRGAPTRGRFTPRELGSACLAALGALALIGPWPELFEGAVSRHPRTVPSAAEGFLAAWRLDALARPAAERGGFEGLELLVGEHGALWSWFGEWLFGAWGPERRLAVVSLAVIGFAAVATYGLGRVLGLRRPAAVACGWIWTAAPLFAERGLLGPAGFAPPTVPLATLGCVLALASGDRRAGSALFGGLLAGAALAGSLWIGPTTSVATLGGVMAAALMLPLVRWRAWTPGFVGVVAATAIGVSMYFAAQAVEGRLESDTDRPLAVPLSVIVEQERARPFAGVSPLSSLAKLSPVEADEDVLLDARKLEAGSPADGPEHLDASEVSGSTALRIADGSGPALPLDGSYRAPVVPVGLLVLAAFGLVGGIGRYRVVVALGLSGLAAGLGSELLAPALWSLTLLLLALTAGEVLFASDTLSGREGDRTRVRLGPGGRLAVVALLVLESSTHPRDLAETPASPMSAAVGDSPLAGSVVEVPFRRGAGTHHVRAWVHRRSTPMPIAPARTVAELESVAVVAPVTLMLAVDGVLEDAELLAAELDWLDVEHLLVQTDSVENDVVDALDRMHGWERAATTGGPGEVMWWYRAKDLWSATPVATGSAR